MKRLIKWTLVAVLFIVGVLGCGKEDVKHYYSTCTDQATGAVFQPTPDGQCIKP